MKSNKVLSWWKMNCLYHCFLHRNPCQSPVWLLQKPVNYRFFLGGGDQNVMFKQSQPSGCKWEANLSNSVSTNVITSAGNCRRRIVCETDNLLKEYGLSHNVSVLCLTELRTKGSRNCVVRRMTEEPGNNTSFLCTTGLEILGSKITVLEKVAKTSVLNGSRHCRESEESLGV